MIARMMPVFLFVALVLAMFSVLTREDQTPEVAIVRETPAVKLVDFSNKPVQLPQDKWVLVNFFASWCVPCVIEHPQLMELQKKLPIVGINYRDGRENAQAMLKSRGNPFVAVAADKAGEAALAYGIAGVPESFLINPEGQIVWHFAGPIMQTQLDEIKEQINARP